MPLLHLVDVVAGQMRLGYIGVVVLRNGTRQSKSKKRKSHETFCHRSCISLGFCY